MKKLVFLFTAFFFSVFINAQIISGITDESCLPVPWVNAELLGNGDVYLTWAIPCETCQVKNYSIAKCEFNPCTGILPQNEGSLTIVGNASNNSTFYTYNRLPNEDSFVYSFVVIARYDTCDSELVFSNIIYYNEEQYYNVPYNFVVNISLEDGSNPLGANVDAAGNNCYYEALSFNEQAGIDGNAIFSDIVSGTYNLTISKPGYLTAVIDSFYIYKDSTASVVLSLGTGDPPSTFSVDAHSGIANWAMPALKNQENAPLSFNLRLSDSMVANVPGSESSYQFESLQNNIEYHASISAVYDWGESFLVDYTWTSNFVGINEFDLSFKIKIFPNPATSQLNIQSEVEMEEITLLNAFGQVVFSKQINDAQTMLNTSSFNSGIYFIKIKTQKGVVNRKIVINH